MADCKNLDLARQWADGINAGVPVLAQAGHRAAAEMIRDLPDSLVDADKLRDVIDAWHHVLLGGDIEKALRRLLPAPPAPTPPTLADMTPDERAECQWMQAEVDGRAYEGRAVITDIVEAEGKAKTILPNGQQFSFHISIVTPLPELPRLEWPGSEDFDTPESASPRSEDVPVGEPWQVEIEGRAAIGYRNHPESRLCWAVVYRDTADHDWLYDTDVTLVARLVPETAEQDDAPEFDPAYTYSDRHGDVWHYEEEEWWCYQNHYRTFRANGTPPAEYGPYTRIEKEETNA